MKPIYAVIFGLLGIAAVSVAGVAYLLKKHKNRSGKKLQYNLILDYGL